MRGREGIEWGGAFKNSRHSNDDDAMRRLPTGPTLNRYVHCFYVNVTSSAFVVGGHFVVRRQDYRASSVIEPSKLQLRTVVELEYIMSTAIRDQRLNYLPSFNCR